VLRLPPEEVDKDTAMRSLGLDSLMGLELLNRLRAATGSSLPATLLWSCPTLAALEEHLGGTLDPVASEARRGPATNGHVQEAPGLAAVEGMTSAELEGELARELEQLGGRFQS
jgi:epothilone polyketide synthase E